ncbi:MAG: hypothetical protein WCT03_09750 [Candidatus Obscuribacterales bacterium]|jgi:hypothetical protein
MSDDNDKAPEPKLQTEGSGAGGGRKIKTALGFSDFSDGGSIPLEPLEPTGPMRTDPIKYSHLKDKAIDALIWSPIKDWQSVYDRLVGRFPEFDIAQEGLVDVLALMVITAYEAAEQVHDFQQLQSGCWYFSDEQLVRIISVTSRVPRRGLY